MTVIAAVFVTAAFMRFIKYKITIILEGFVFMASVVNLLTALGENFYLVVIACVEILVAVILVAVFAGKKGLGEKTTEAKGSEKIFLKEMQRFEDETNLLLRLSDLMPVYFSGKMEDIIGVTVDELKNDISNMGSFIKDRNLGLKYWNEYRSWNGEGCFKRKIVTKNEKYILLCIRRSGDKLYDMVSFRDITRFEKEVESYEKRLHMAEEASRSKTTFLSRMSHEIRTPMNGITGMITLAKSKMDKSSPALQYLEKADELSDHLLSIINDILDMSRIEAGKVELEKRVISLKALGQKLYDMFAKNLDARGIKYQVNFEGLMVDYVIGDELRISQVIINFLSNAVKFTNEGEIIVTFRQMMLKDNTVDLMIRVHDTGVGMSSEFINRIFRPFEQEGVDTARKYGGTGLGMAITDQLVKLMGGEIIVESTVGKGSDFSVFLSLPVAEEYELKQEKAAEAKEEKPEVSTENSFKGRRILVAEDNEINAMIAKEILEDMGAEFDLAENGKIAVEKFETNPENYYDFILMDVQMPVMDGRSAAKKIRTLSRKDAASIPIFALSADAFVEDERLSAESGMNGHYAKPIDFVQLQKSIGQFLYEKENGERK